MLAMRQSGWLCVAISLGVAWQGHSWQSTAAIATTVKSFPFDHGKVLGLLKSFFGLSGAIITALTTSFLAEEHAHQLSGRIGLLLCFAIACCLLGGAASFFTNAAPEEDRLPLHGQNTSLVTLGYILTVVLAVVLSVGTLSGISYTPGFGYCTASYLLLFGMYPLLGTSEPPPRDATALLQQHSSIDLSSTGSLPAWKQRRFWLLFISMFCGTGSGLTLLNNIGQVSRVTAADNNNVIVFMRVTDCLGRMLAGYASDAYRKNYSRPVFFAVALALNVLSMVRYSLYNSLFW